MVKIERRGLVLAGLAALCSPIGWVPVVMLQTAPLYGYRNIPMARFLGPIAALVWGVLDWCWAC